MEAKDFFGVEINIGDEVAFMQTGYRQFIIGKIVKITDHYVFIEHDKTNTSKTNTKQFHGQVFKKPN